MKALSVVPGVAGSLALSDIEEPRPEAGAVLIAAVALGVCGTDREIVAGLYGAAPPGATRLVLGHESLGRVIEAPAGSGVAAGDLVAGIVRRPDPVPCPSCAAGEWDMCQNGKYTEHGIKGLDGFGAERFRLAPDGLIVLDPGLGQTGVLLEPASVLAKAWEQIDRIGARARWTPQRALVTGAGPVGLLAALAARMRGLEVHVLDRETTGPKPSLVESLGATYHVGTIADACRSPDVVVECTGASELVFDAMRCVGPNGITCLTGVSSGRREVSVDAAGLNRELVLENQVVFGSVNANRRHYEAAASLLAQADRRWLEGLITRRVPLTDWRDAFERRAGDVKVAIVF
jgi:threonine dehydrogenase-like Zn-dependent dehydrogenase